jgi:hypothetical protein
LCAKFLIHGVILQTFSAPTVLISGPMGGLEDIPANIVAVVCAGTMDVLSHVAIRARNQVFLE